MTSFGAEPERHDDPLVESCLEEILGGKTPPDLKSDIMRRASGGRNGQVVPPPFQPNNGDVGRPVIQPLTRSTNGRAARSRAANRASVRRYALTMTTGVVVCLLAFAIYTVSTKTSDVALTPDPDVPEFNNDTPPTPPAPAPNAPTPDDVDDPPSSDAGNPQVEPPVNDVQPKAPEVTPFELSGDPTDEQIIALINEHVQKRWELADVQATGPIDDETWCRRVFQRLFGRSMSEEELRSFRRRETPDKRLALLNHVFRDERFKKEFSTYWGNLWSERLLARANPRDAKSMQRGLARYLQSAIQDDRSHDEWATALITAEGSNMLSEDDHNGATNFLLGLRDKDGVRPTTEICRVLLGQRVQCAQCHDDGQAGLTQEQFWQMTAFFRQIDVDGFGPGRARLSELESAETARFQRPDGDWQNVEARFFADHDPAKEPVLEDRRAELARSITDSDLFARAAVNRIWSHFLGYGFTSPVDDMGHRNPASHPMLLDDLARQFKTKGFDTQRLIRWIVMSEPFNRSEVLAVGDNKADIPEISFVALFSRYYHRTTLFPTPHDALVGLSDGQADRLAMMLSRNVLGRVQDSFDEDEDEPGRDADDEKQVDLASQLNIGQLRLARSLAKSRMSSEEKLRHVFLAVMARFPSQAEMRQASRLYESAKDNQIQAMENLIWALTRTQEFVDEH